MEAKKMFVIIKNCNYDFNIEIKTIAVTDNMDKAKEVLQEEIVKEKEEQKVGSLNYDTEEVTETSYAAYNEGYEATDGVRIFISEAEYKNS